MVLRNPERPQLARFLRAGLQRATGRTYRINHETLDTVAPRDLPRMVRDLSQHQLTAARRGGF